MKIAGYEKISLQDYPDHVSCIIFTQGCNIKCPFCQNSTLISNSENQLIDEDEILKYLIKRKNFLDGVTISGGEPTIQKDLKTFILKLKTLGFKVKLDTNGINYIVLKDLIDNNLVDYVAMDIKNSLDKYNQTSGVININIENILKSINLLKQNKVDYEFRTTIIKEHHSLNDILEIIKRIGDSKYYLQNFRDSEFVIDKNLTSFDESELNFWNEVLEDYPNVFIRGIEKRRSYV